MKLIRLKQFLILMLFVSLLVTGFVEVSLCSSRSDLVSAEEILTNISQGNPIVYHNVTILGDLALSNLNLSKDKNGKFLIKSQIDITDSTFNGKVLFGKAKFLKEIILRDNDFKDDVQFCDSEFDNLVFFGINTWGSIFDKQASFQHSIFNHEVYFDSVQFRNINPDFNDLFLNTTFKDRVNFDNASFYGFAYFTGSQFCKDASFQYTKFQRDAIFGDFMGMPGFKLNRIFYDYISIGQDEFYKISKGSIFCNPVNFYRAQFWGDAYFKSTEFRGFSSFKYATFQGDAIFGPFLSWNENSTNSLLRNNNFFEEEQSADFIYDLHKSSDPSSADIIILKRFEAKESRLNFERMQKRMDEQHDLANIKTQDNVFVIENKTLEERFNKTYFQENVSFFRANFRKNLYFNDIIFEKEVDFFGAIFNGDINFDYTDFIGNAYFEATQTNEDANFAFAKFHQNANFNSSEFGGDAYFGNALFYHILYFTDVKFDHIFIYMSDIRSLVCNDGFTYNSLIKNFRELEQYDDADNIYLQYMNWKHKQLTPFDFQWYQDLVSSWTCGYGVKPWNTIGFGGLLWLFFSIIYYMLNFQSKFFDACWFSAFAILSLPKEATPIRVDEYYEIKHRKFLSMIIRFIYIFERLLGWALLVVFINTLSRIMIRY